MASSSSSSAKRLARRFTRAQINDMMSDVLIGSGGFGDVYKGYLRDEGLPVAIKVMSSKNSLDDFLLEKKILMESHCDHIIKLIGFCQEDNYMCLVFEYIENKSLDAHLLSKESLADFYWFDRIKVVKGVAKALLHLHQRGIAHRDIKPANILLRFDMNPKLADFGTAVFVEGSAPSCVGTFGYLDPHNLHFPTMEMDLYSFGVLVIEVLSGKPIFFPDVPVNHATRLSLGEWAKGTAAKDILHPYFHNLETEPSDITAALLDCIEMAKRCLLKPDERPDINEVVATLEACPKPESFARWKNLA